MSIEFQYFTAHYAIEVHDSIIREFGGLMGIKDAGLIDSTLHHIQNEFYYPDIEHKLTHLLFSFNKNHCFNDGNKRASLALSVYFLSINGLDIFIDKFIIEMENIVVDVADNRIDKDLLFEIITSLLYEDDYSEELKLKIIDAKMKNLNLDALDLPDEQDLKKEVKQNQAHQDNQINHGSDNLNTI